MTPQVVFDWATVAAFSISMLSGAIYLAFYIAFTVYARIQDNENKRLLKLYAEEVIASTKSAKSSGANF